MQAAAPRASGIPGAQLRILLALEAAGGGAGRHVIDLAKGLIGRGHTTHLAWSPDRAEASFISALPSIERLVCHAVPMSRNLGRQDVASCRALRALLASGRFDVIHGHSSKAGALTRLASIGSGLPAIYTPHALITLDPELSLARRVVYGMAERLLAPFAERIICVSEEERAHALRLGIDSRRLAVVPNGLAPMPPADRPAARHTLGLRDSDICVGFVGRLSAQKAVHRLLEAFAAALVEKGPSARLAIVGDGPDRANLEALAAHLGIAGRVNFAGHADGALLMAGFDLFVLPSRYEAFPYVLLEAAARGLPIVTTDVGGASAVVRAGENGHIVRHADGPADLIAAMSGLLAALIGDQARREQMGRRSAEISRAFTVEAMVENTLAVYRNVLAVRLQ